MRSITKRLARIALALVALAAFATPALAAAPTNDTFANAKVVSIGFSETLDTSQATTDSIDAQLNQNCGAPATDASVWYAIDGTGGGVKVDASTSSYSAGVLVATGTPGDLTTIACGPQYTAFKAEAGTRYYVMVFDDQEDGRGNGGTLNIQFQPTLAPDVDFSLNRYGKFDSRAGSVTLSGSYTCSAGASFNIFVDVSQKVGRGSVTGFGFFEGACDGTPQPWSVVIEPDSGKFAGGKLQTTAFGVAFGEDLNTEQEITQTVQLRKKK